MTEAVPRNRVNSTGRTTKETPGVPLDTEQKRMMPLAAPPADFGVRSAVPVGPVPLVDFKRVKYALPARACGIPTMLHLCPDRVETVEGHSQAHQPRFPKVGRTRFPPERWAEQLAAGAGGRKQLNVMREWILELGLVGEVHLSDLIHARPHAWTRDVQLPFALPEEDALSRVGSATAKPSHLPATTEANR